MSLTTSEELFVRRQKSVEIWQVIPLILAAAFLTIGLSMFLSGTEKLIDVVQPVIVVFGGALVGLLLTFSTSHLGQALQIALVRGIRGGNSPGAMIKAMLKVCEVSRRDGLLGVADIRSNSEQVEEICCLIGDASDDESIRFALERRIASEQRLHQMSSDVFIFTGIYALLIGILGSLLLFVSPSQDTLSGAVAMPFVCGASLAILMCILVGRLRSAHLRELLMAEIAYKTASIILEDNNVQHLRSRLGLLVTTGL